MADQVQGGPVSDPAEVIRAMGLVFSNSYLYGPKHGVTVQATQQAFVVVSQILGDFPEVSISIADDAMMVNGNAVETKNPLARMFLTRMKDMDLNTFSLTSGMTEEEFRSLLEVMNSKPDVVRSSGGFSAMLTSHGIQSVKTKAVTYVAVTEDEVVVSKDEMAAGQGGGQVESIMAFLQGSMDKADADVAKAMVEAVDDSAKLADIILHAAEVRHEAVDLNQGESMESLVVGCLQKTFQALQEDPSSKTQKGKKALQKTLVLLEKELIEKMRQAGLAAPGEEEKISEAVEEMRDELEIGALAEEYMKKRDAIDGNEKKILRFIKSKGLEKVEESDLKERLLDGGLSTSGWRELLLKSGVLQTHGPDHHFSAIGRLAVLLDHMHKTVQTGDKEQAADALQQVLHEVKNEVDALVDQTEKKIQDIVVNARADEDDDKEGVKPDREKRLPRRKLFELLAEIGQEICQPLAVINASMDMLIGGMAGAVTEMQKEMLQLVAESSTRLNAIAQRLIEIAGVPETRVPDSKVINTIYKDS